jgi:hypothetical protein
MPPLPLRASVNDKDWSPRRYEGLIVKLDGIVQVQASVCAYDVPRGTVTRAVLDERGGIQLAPGTTNEIWIEKVSGIVEVSRA